MKRIGYVLGALLVAAAMQVGAAETWTKVSLVDTMCSLKAKAAPDKHTRECALDCADGGYGIIASDGTYLKFDKAGNDQALAMLKASKAADHLRVTVTGTRKGETIAVASLQAAE
ncbi:MAG TPA: hypothetical protein VM096_13920 [Vicinamibacterales bacterium]|nr:hypothetical protein [Vicinamibacterales bacterium]